MTQWLKTVSAGLCILTILLHLVPQGKFAKYVRSTFDAEKYFHIFPFPEDIRRILYLHSAVNYLPLISHSRSHICNAKQRTGTGADQ